MLAVFVPLTVVATAFSPEGRLSTAVAMSVSFAVIIGLVMVMWSHRPAWFSSPVGPLKDLDPDERWLVSRAVRSGQAVPDPRLAQVALNFARRDARDAWVIIAASGVSLAIRIWTVTDARTAVGRGIEILGALLWLGSLAYGVRRLIRARRSEAATVEVLRLG
jgi:hypothetical protein